MNLLSRLLLEDPEMAPDNRPPFASYLLPSFTLPFRRRQSSTTSNASDASAPSLSFSPRSSISASPGSSPPTTYTTPHFGHSLIHEALQNAPLSGPPKQAALHRAQPNTLKCITCSTDLGFASQIVSKGFTGRHGRAYLVAPPTPNNTTNYGTKQELINTKLGRNVNRELLTGAHVVADVSCAICSTVLGWKYVDAREMAQRYKIGKYILEMKRVVLIVGWEDGVFDVGEGARGIEEEEEYKVKKDEEDDDDADVIVFDEDDEDECEDLFAGVWAPEVVAKRRGRRVGGRR